MAPSRDATSPRPRRGVSWPAVSTATAGFLGVAPIAAGQGGYFPSAWGWLGMGACWVAVLALAVCRDLRVPRLGLWALGGACVLTALTAASALWTSSTTLTLLDTERTLAYLAVFGALLLLARPGSAALLVGCWAAIVVVALYALGTHLLPERFGWYTDPLQSGRLYQPVGYWNALGLFCAMGMLLAIGLTDREDALPLRVVTCSSLPVLAAAAYFTFSRGAWAATGVAVICVVAVTPHRLRYVTTLLVTCPLPAAAVAYAAHLGPLVASRDSPSQIEPAGARAAIILAAATVACGAVSLILATVQRRLRPSTRSRRLYAATLATIAVASAAGTIAASGFSFETVRTFKQDLTAEQDNQSNLNNRLLSVSLSGRQLLWRVALDESQHHPLEGGGGGTFATYWLRHRPLPQFVVDAHELYLETLAELGLVGLVSVVLLLTPALVAAVRSRSNPLTPAALGAYVAFIVHAAVDWDWEVPAVMVPALITGAVLLAQSRGPAPIRLGAGLRWVTGTTLALITAVCGLGLAGNHALSAGASALGDHRYQAALADASDAHRWVPWSDQPYIVAGRAHLDLHNRAAAARSFRIAVRKDSSDWVAWQWLARATTGAPHTAAMKRLLALDPRYDVADGRP
jgi:O-Antigen ligase